jgi:hypothetical protein
VVEVGRDIASGALPDPRRYAIGFVAVGDDDDTLAVRCGAQLLNYSERFVARAYENKIDIFIGRDVIDKIGGARKKQDMTTAPNGAQSMRESVSYQRPRVYQCDRQSLLPPFSLPFLSSFHC